MAFKFLIAPGLMISLTCVVSAQVSGDHLYDTEPDVTWTPPKDEAEFKDYSVGANYSGLLFAGWTEFNWVLDLRTEDTDQDLWAVGNLVTHLHVLTTARAIDGLQMRSSSLKTPYKDEVHGWNVDVYFRYSDIRIHYCESYLQAEWDIYTNDVDRRTSGTRSVQRMIRHPKRSKLSFDAAIIVMTAAIPQIEPRVGTMPTGFDYSSDLTQEQVQLDPMKPPTHASPVCYVASFGKNYVNHKEFFVLDYKVKFRVYVTPWATCRDSWEYICSSGDLGCDDPGTKNDGRKELYCLRPRAKVGTVCDHDKGAPLVCNGQVIGLVVRGAKFRHCNNRYKIPFIVERIDNYAQFVDDSVSYVVHPVSKKTDPTTETTTNPVALSCAMGLLSFAFPAMHLALQSISFLGPMIISEI